ncbi:hypothetical protein SKAU_G00372130 [Synaphobranchus kaupii]|uniref:snRNA-activating protein complex subunit 2 n=1 Tax=Synaphobranchus kaupii TaxID=118154 RepID=A0A9Q1EG96_SYNKA|nr:hypothetical protein SKAU_G00372130 [Synaphobranchus kaupii]
MTPGENRKQVSCTVFSAPAMKPPSRKRSAPRRFAPKLPEPKQRPKGCSGWFGWNLRERRVLLVQLKKQRNNAELDLVALQAKLPKRSIEQIESFVQFLKTCVGKKVFRMVNKLRREKESGKVPIELWTEMAQKMAGSQEGAISSAFSQMLVIAATEPCSLLNSDPPRPLGTPQQPPSKLKTVPLSPMARPPVQTSSTGINRTGHKSPQLSSSQTPERPNMNRQKSSLPSSTAGASPSIANLACCSQSSLPNLAAATLPKNTKLKGGSTSNNSPSPKSPLPNHAPASLSQASIKHGLTTPKSSQPAEQAASPDTRTSTQGQEHTSSTPSKDPISDQQTSSKTLKDKDFVVDFENIYRYLNAANKKADMPPLSAMESAVVLDLLLSLPEQIPLLNCVELQHHLHQVHDHLSAPVKKPPQVGGDPPGTPLQGDISTIQEGGHCGQSVSSMPSTHTGSTASDAQIESTAFCSIEMEKTALPQTLPNQEGNGKVQGDIKTPGNHR